MRLSNGRSIDRSSVEWVRIPPKQYRDELETLI